MSIKTTLISTIICVSNQLQMRTGAAFTGATSHARLSVARSAETSTRETSTITNSSQMETLSHSISQSVKQNCSLTNKELPLPTRNTLKTWTPFQLRSSSLPFQALPQLDLLLEPLPHHSASEEAESEELIPINKLLNHCFVRAHRSHQTIFYNSTLNTCDSTRYWSLSARSLH